MLDDNQTAKTKQLEYEEELFNEIGQEPTVDDDRPHMTSPEWNDYVMGLFTVDELVNDMPMVAGLRRVAESILGLIIESGPVQVFPPQNDHSHGRATVHWGITFSNGSRFSDVADCWEGNTDDKFCVFSVATAATRAEARALRKALRIKSVAAEEITSKDTAEIVRSNSQVNTSTKGEYDEGESASSAQKNFIDIKCKQTNINGKKFLFEIFKTNYDKIVKVKASAAIDQLNEYQREPGIIPESIIGYNSNWRN